MARKIKAANILERREGDSSAETRWIAKLYGLRFYRTWVLCRNGHDAPRLASTGECVSCTADRWTRWAKAHPELAREKRERMMVLGRFIHDFPSVKVSILEIDQDVLSETGPRGHDEHCQSNHIEQHTTTRQTNHGFPLCNTTYELSTEQQYWLAVT